MKGNNPKPIMVKKRLQKKLEKDDKWSAARSTVIHLINNDLEKEDISSTDDFLDDIIPGIAAYNPDWMGIETVKDLKSSEVLKELKQHMRNLKSKDSKIQVHIDAERTLRADVPDNSDAEPEGAKSKTHSNSEPQKYVQKIPANLKKTKDVKPFTTTQEEVNQPEDQQDLGQHGMDILPTRKAYTAIHITLIDNEVELEAAIMNMKVCRAKSKSAFKRVEELEKIRHALQVKIHTDSEWVGSIFWKGGHWNLDARGNSTARVKTQQNFFS